ncbi:MAG: hypothetical protein CVV09_13450 [Gammaproteobacteria bacterium HGW-Gammaproteobacteria-13]|nr:MAG: hypothetical protein CVV09_13450 [Gammaproteobacteria bacterium HGW-Gammaproteobacteria-13]
MPVGPGLGVPSGGRVESLCKGVSGMDAARAAMGQGWPFAACPWSRDGAREVERSETRMWGALSLWLLSLCARKEKVTRPTGRNRLAKTVPKTPRWVSQSSTQPTELSPRLNPAQSLFTPAPSQRLRSTPWAKQIASPA